MNQWCFGEDNFPSSSSFRSDIINMKQGESNTQKKVVKKLLEEKPGVGHSVYMGNYYISVQLTEELPEENTYITGTLKPTRKGNPKEVINRKLTSCESIARYNSKGVEFVGEMVDVCSRSGWIVKPRMIKECNNYVSGVDRKDQMLSYYTCEHKLWQWYNELGIHLLQIMLNNAHMLYNRYSGINISLYDLVVIEKSLQNIPPPAQFHVMHLPEYCPKGNKKRRKDSIYYCPQCPENPGFRLTPCFRNYHELSKQIDFF
ncbi:hypothetical protein J437_LFUL006608 [Ladona fulva]|uniref:PiggyBac transposable element-derived protein domain-containing protein n=1 Tax=Ladona fulva TaxID=123851 RepID=A0A8K0KIY5_LADFU|nr:hypothetical protein J437_LFUL006608 [Ladona fulva]